MRTPEKRGSNRLAGGLADLKRLRKQAAKQSPAPKPGRQAQSTGKGGPASPSPQDIALFRRAMAHVTPIKDTRRAILPAMPVQAAEILRQRRERAMGEDAPAPLDVLSDQFHPASPSGNDSSFVRSGHGPDLLKGLRKGKWLAQASLDLHGNTLEQARERFDRFLQSCLAHQIRCVRIVHGKGYGSRDGEPVLKQTVRRWLRQLEAVQAYSECAEQDGGAGAVQILLRTNMVQSSEGSTAK